MDKRLLDILCCPVTRLPLRLLDESELSALNRAIAAGSVSNHGGAAISAPLAAALLTRDGRTIYRIDDDIPVMLVDESIPTERIADFPSR